MQTSPRSSRLFFLAVVAVAFVGSALVHLLISKVVIGAGRPSHPLAFALLMGVLLAGLPLLWYVRTRKLPTPEVLGVLFLVSVSVFLVSIYLFRTSSYLTTRADILIWSESGYVSNIIKFRTGTPIYGVREDNNTVLYTPGSEVLTYLIAAALGNGTSIPFYRGIHLVYVLLACVFATASCVQLARAALPDDCVQHTKLWIAFWFPGLFLIATNSVTSPFAHALNTGALRLLVGSIAFWLMVKHTGTGDSRWLVPMAILPAVGFLIKQDLVVWAGIFAVYLIVQRPMAARRTIAFVGVSSLLVGSVVGMCFLLWGKMFFYWVFYLPRAYPVSLLRVFDHALQGWIFIALGLFGGWALLRDQSFRRLLPLWAAWFLLMSAQVYTSGIAWMLHHMAPASLLAGIWFFVGLLFLWPRINRGDVKSPVGAQLVLSTALAVALVSILYGGMGFFRLPVKPVSADLERYLEEIEKEFEGIASDRVLLDVGSWVYLKDNAVMKDRAAPIVDQVTVGQGDVSQTINRIGEKQYAKIIVRRLHSDDFLYEWAPGVPYVRNGIRAAMLENYHEVRQIQAVVGTEWLWNYLVSEVFVLEPNASTLSDQKPSSGL